MARTTLTKTTAKGPFAAYSAGTADLAMSAATGSSGSSGNQFAAGGNDLVIAYNSNSGVTAHTVTLTSKTDSYNRVGDIGPYSIAAGGYAVFGPFGSLGWTEADGMFYLEASHAEILFGIIKLP